MGAYSELHRTIQCSSPRMPQEQYTKTVSVSVRGVLPRRPGFVRSVIRELLCNVENLPPAGYR